MATFNPGPEEPVHKKGMCMRTRALVWNTNGTAYVTARRFVFCTPSLIAGTAGRVMPLLTILQLISCRATAISVEIPLGDIQSVQNARHGLVRKLIIRTRSGKTYKMVIYRSEQWMEALTNALQAHQPLSRILRDGHTLTVWPEAVPDRAA